MHMQIYSCFKNLLKKSLTVMSFLKLSTFDEYDINKHTYILIAFRFHHQ